MHTGFELDKPMINGTNAIAATFEWCVWQLSFRHCSPVLFVTRKRQIDFDSVARNYRYQYHAAQFHSATKFGGGRAHPNRPHDNHDGDSDFVWVDQCSGDKYFPPCDAVCPASPDARGIAAHVTGFAL